MYHTSSFDRLEEALGNTWSLHKQNDEFKHSSNSIKTTSKSINRKPLKEMKRPNIPEITEKHTQ